MLRAAAVAATGLCWLLLTAAADGLQPGKRLDQYVYQHWTTAEGFVGGSIYSIAQSSDGYLWIGTDRGLVRFNGRTFTLIQRPFANGPTIGRVREILRDGSGQLWIRAEGIHLLVYRDGGFHDPFMEYQLDDTPYTAATINDAGQLLLTALGRSAVQFERNNFKVIANALDIPGTIVAMAESRGGRIWMGTRDEGIYQVEQGRIIPGPQTLQNVKINSLLPAHNGGLWVGTDHGLHLITRDGAIRDPSYARAARNQILSLAKDSDGNVWAGSANGLIRITTAEQQSLRPSMGATSRVAAVFEDAEGNLWFGGENGLECLRDGAFTHYAEAGTHEAQRTGSVAADAHGRIWFAPMSGGLRMLDKGVVQRVELPELGKDVIYSIDGGADEIWLGRQNGGLTRVWTQGGTPSSRTWSKADGLAQNTVYTVHRSPRGGVWAGTLSGGASYWRDGVMRTFNTSNGLSSNTVNTIAEEADGTIWLGTPLGLNEYRNGRWLQWNLSTGLPSLDVRICFVDAEGVLWIVTAEGLAWIEDGHVHVPATVPDLLREQIQSMTEDKLGFFWFLTSDHLLRVPREALHRGTLREEDLQLYSANEGAAGNDGARRDHSMVSDAQGRIWIALNDGVAMTDPSPSGKDSAAMTVRVESLACRGVQYPPQSRPVLPAGSADVTIQFEASTLTGLDRARYRYRLAGVDGDWSPPVALREVRYNNLAPGSYQFEVLASRDGILWNSQPARVSFTIARAFWQTWWFRLSAGLAVVLIALGMVRLRTLEMSRQLHARFQGRLNERTRIAQELHDTLLQNFQGLLLRFQTVDMLILEHPEKAKQELETALDRADDALRAGREAIQGIRKPSDEASDVVNTLNTMLQDICTSYCADGRSRPEFSVIVEGPARRISTLAICDIERIACEAVRNCLQHSQAKRIEVELAFGRRHLRICIRDDGIGIDTAVLAQGSRAGHWGLIGMRERAEQLRARLNVWSRPGAGTEVELKIPAEVAYGGEDPATQKRTMRWMKWRRG